MATITKDQVKAYLSALSPSELQELILDLEERWGIERLYTGTVGHVTMGMEPEVMGVPVYSVVLEGAGPRRIEALKALRRLRPLGLREAKAIVDAAPVVVAEDVTREEAEVMRDELVAAGATVTLR